MQFVYELAFLHRETAGLNLAALVSGRDPEDLQRETAGTILEASGIGMSAESLTHTVDDAGQLTIRPRFALRRSSVKGRCPASFHKTEINGRRQTSLLTVMHIMADVAVDHVYPSQFSITEDTPTGS